MRHWNFPASVIDDGAARLDFLVGRLPRDRRNAANTLGDPFLRQDLEVADQARLRQVRAAAEFDRVVEIRLLGRLGPDQHDPHRVRVLLAEDGADPGNLLRPCVSGITMALTG